MKCCRLETGGGSLPSGCVIWESVKSAAVWKVGRLAGGALRESGGQASAPFD